jgi:hypothetical protein
MNHFLLSACKRLAAEIQYLDGLMSNLSREEFMEDPTLQRAAAFSLRILQHNLMSLKKMEIPLESPIAAWMDFDFKPDLSLCVSYKRAPHDMEKPLIWKYLENRLPLLHGQVQALLPLLPQPGEEGSEISGEEADDDDAESDGAGPSPASGMLGDPRRLEWNKVLMEYNKVGHQFLASSGQIRRYHSLNNLPAVFPETFGEAEIEQLLRAAPAEGETPQDRAEYEGLVNQALSDLRGKRRLMTQIERIVASEADMLRAFQVPELPAIGALAVVLLYPNPLDVNQKKFISQMGYTPHAPRARHSGMEAARRQILRHALDEAAKAVFETPDETSFLYLWARKEMEIGKRTPHHILFNIGRKLSGMLWHFIRAHPFKDIRIQNAFALKLSRFANRLGEEYIRELGYESCPDYVTQTCAGFYTAQKTARSLDAFDEDGEDADTDVEPEVEPPAAEEDEDETVKTLMKIKGRLRFVDPNHVPAPVEKRKPGRPRKNPPRAPVRTRKPRSSE